MPDPLTSEAISNYIVFIGGIIAGVVGWLLVRWVTRKRPRIIRIVKVSGTPLLEVDSEVKDDIAISYRGDSVTSLHRTDFSVENASNQTIDDVEVTIHFRNPGLMDVDVKDNIAQRGTTATIVDSGDRLKVLLPFINSEKLYDDEVRIRTLSRNSVEVTEVTGGGREWKVEFVDRQRIIAELTDELIDELSVHTPVALVRNPWLILQVYIRVAPKILSYLQSR
jgi:hypothetical protein